MGITLPNIIAGFYFLYWIYRDSQPFSIWWLIGLYASIFILESIITSILKKSADTIETEAKDIRRLYTDLNNRLTKLERGTHK